MLSEFARLMKLVIGALREGKSATQLSGEELQLHPKAACMAITTNLIKVITVILSSNFICCNLLFNLFIALYYYVRGFRHDMRTERRALLTCIADVHDSFTPRLLKFYNTTMQYAAYFNINLAFVNM